MSKHVNTYGMEEEHLHFRSEGCSSRKKCRKSVPKKRKGDCVSVATGKCAIGKSLVISGPHAKGQLPLMKRKKPTTKKPSVTVELIKCTSAESAGTPGPSVGDCKTPTKGDEHITRKLDGDLESAVSVKRERSPSPVLPSSSVEVVLGEAGDSGSSDSEVSYDLRLDGDADAPPATPLQCADCSETLAGEERLLHHRKHQHPDKRAHQCTVCSKAFCRKADLGSHQRTHTGEKPYKCSQCDMSFARIDNLRGHELVHTGERPFKCNECGAGFKRSNHLAVHSRLHSGLKPIRCLECGKAFAQWAGLAYHRKTNPECNV